MKKLVLSFCIFHFSFFTFHLSEAQILHVPADYPTIQSAVDAAGCGDTVLVSPETYLENIVILGNDKTITLASEFLFSGDTNDINNTIIDASEPQNPNYGMAIFIKNQDSTLDTRIIGFTITGGTGYYITNGGGINTIKATPNIEFNHIQNCSATGNFAFGGGIRIGNTGGDTSKVCLIRNNVIKNCTIYNANQIGIGAGIGLENVSADIEDNQIINNIITGDSNAITGGAGIEFEGWSSAFNFPQVLIKNNQISFNEVLSGLADGGGIDISGYLPCQPVLVIEGNTITHNEVHSNATINVDGYAEGGAIYLRSPGQGSILSGNEISDNKVLDSPKRWGGGIYLERNSDNPPETMPLIEKNRFTGNNAGEGGAIYSLDIGIKLVNNYVYQNMADSMAGAISLNWLYNYIPVTEIINNTIDSNSVNLPGGAAGSMLINGKSRVLMMNNIFFDNTADNEINIYEAAVEIYNCDIDTDEIAGLWTGENNFPADPEFITELAWDCLNHEAPCSEKGIDIVFAFDQWFEAPDDCIMNNPRPQDEFVDIGACEVKLCWVGYPENPDRNQIVKIKPNPFIDYTTLEYELEQPGEVTLTIFDDLSRQVLLLVNERQEKGRHQVQWNAEDLPAGIYSCRLAVGGQRSAVGKLVKY